MIRKITLLLISLICLQLPASNFVLGKDKTYVEIIVNLSVGKILMWL